MICRVCGKPIERRQVSGLVVWGHLRNPANAHHYAKPPRAEVEPQT